LSLNEAALPRFSAEFERVAREWLSPAALQQTLETDGELDPAELTSRFAQEVAAQVWGQGFPLPVFDGKFTVVDQRRLGDDHSKLVLMATGKRLDAIAFNEPGPLPARIWAAYRPELNYYQGLVSLQLVLERWEADAGSE